MDICSFDWVWKNVQYENSPPFLLVVQDKIQMLASDRGSPDFS